MPTVNPRINVTLSPSSDALVQRLAALQGASKAQVLRELLEAAEPALHRAVALMEAAQGANRAVLDGLAESLERAQDRAQAVYAKHMADADALTIDLVTQAEAVRSRRPARAAPAVKVPRGAARAGKALEGPQNPPASNRGVKSAKLSRSSNGRGSA